jgi:hypothetical protein
VHVLADHGNSTEARIRRPDGGDETDDEQEDRKDRQREHRSQPGPKQDYWVHVVIPINPLVGAAVQIQ